MLIFNLLPLLGIIYSYRIFDPVTNIINRNITDQSVEINTNQILILTYNQYQINININFQL
jgi:hypothetical protein